MPNGGSVNQIVSSDLTTTSLGELSGLPSNLSISVMMLPSNSVRVRRRVSCSQVTRRPCRSRVLPLALLDGWRKTLILPVSSCQRMMRLLGISLHSKYRPAPNQAGHWDRNRTRHAVGEGLPFPLFRLRAGSQSHHGARFPTPPYNPGRSGFPSPV